MRAHETHERAARHGGFPPHGFASGLLAACPSDGSHDFYLSMMLDVPVPRVPMCVCSIESGPCERVDVFHVSGRFWSTSACGEKRTPARPAWTSFPS